MNEVKHLKTRQDDNRLFSRRLSDSTAYTYE